MATDKVVPMRRKPKPKPTATAKPFPVRVAMVLTLDGEAKGAMTTEAELVQPPEGEGQQIVWVVDVRQLAEAIAPLIGVELSAAKRKIWTPKD